MKVNWILLRNSLCVILALYLVYLMAFALFPYFKKKDPSTEFCEEVESYNFYADEPCVDRVALVEDPIVSLGTRIRLLSEAKNTIDIAYYSLHMGKTTDSFLAAVLDAADRGVKVRFLLDGMSNGFKKEYIYLANALGSHKNIEIRLYNPVNIFKPWTINGRMHDKYIIIDNTFLLLGGRNIGDKYFGPDGYDKNLSIDRDVLVYNTKHDEENNESVLFQVRDYMNTVWDYEYTHPAFVIKSKESDKEKERLKSIIKTIKEQHPHLFTDPLDIENQTFPANKITFFANDISIYKKEPKVGYIIREILTDAKEKVILQSPYIVLSDNIKTALDDFGKTGKQYEILTNSMQSSPNLPAYSLYLSDKKDILESGAKIFEFQDNNAIHAKTYIVDNRMSVIGSFNMDPRSEYIDTEIMLAIDSEEFTNYLLDIVDLYKGHSLVVGKDGKYLENPLVEEFHVNPLKRITFKVIGKILSPFRVLL